MRGPIEKLLQVRFQFAAIFFTKIAEFERLQTALRGPHGKDHDCLAADRARTDAKKHLDLDSLVQRVLHMQQPSGDRELVQPGVNLAAILQPNESQYGSGQLYALGAPPAG